MVGLKTAGWMPAAVRLIPLILVLRLGAALLSHDARADEDNLPSDAQIEKAAKAALPAHLMFRCVQNRSHEIVKGVVRFQSEVTVSVTEPLFEDATEETFAEQVARIPAKSELPPPTVLKKLRRAGEIVELQMQLQFKQTDEGWNPASSQDYGRLEKLGKPLAAFKTGALVVGTPEARRAIEQYLADLKKQAAAGTNKTPSASTPPPKTAADPSKPAAATGSDETVVDSTEEPEAEPAGDLAKLKDWERAVYALKERGKSTVDYTALKSVENKARQTLASKVNDDTVQKFIDKSKDQILALSDNYRAAAHNVEMENKTCELALRVAYETFAEAYNSLARGDINSARSRMKRAQEKRTEAQIAAREGDANRSLHTPSKTKHYKPIGTTGGR